MAQAVRPVLVCRYQRERIARTGVELLACEPDLDVIVPKLKHGAYGEGWFKIRNPTYSQYEGRRFEKRFAAGV